jgi:SAM-dependent methyltransferase
MSAAKTPKEIADEAHRGYYAAGGYSDDRYAWTIRTFMPACSGVRILEVGCGNGGPLELLKSTNEVIGVDASADGIAACASRGIESYCMDPSSEPLPFPAESFDVSRMLGDHGTQDEPVLRDDGNAAGVEAGRKVCVQRPESSLRTPHAVSRVVRVRALSEISGAERF